MKTFRYFLVIILLIEPAIILCNTQVENGKHFVGELYGGGIVFSVDRTGEHGLICSISDIRINKPSVTTRETIKNTGSSSPYKYDNPKITATDAIESCDDYSNSDFGKGVFSDWQLPTINQLEMLFKEKTAVNKTLEGIDKKYAEPLNKIYYSSSMTHDERFGEYWLFDINDGYRITLIGSGTRQFLTGIRAVREF